MNQRADEMASEARSVTRDPDVCGGVPVLQGTRVRVSDVVVAHDHHGLAPTEITGEFPTLQPEDVHAALAYDRAQPDEIDAEIREREIAFNRQG